MAIVKFRPEVDERIALALSVMETTCASPQQKIAFIQGVLGPTGMTTTAELINRRIAEVARRVARSDQRDELERLLKSNGFIKAAPPKNSVRTMTIEVEVSHDSASSADWYRRASVPCTEHGATMSLLRNALGSRFSTRNKGYGLKLESIRLISSGETYVKD